MQEEDLQALRTAVAALEHPGLAARLAEIAGKPITMFARTLARVQQHILDDGVGTLAVLRARQASGSALADLPATSPPRETWPASERLRGKH